MDILFLAVIILLFILAVFDLSVGVSNDAVNFMTSALGSKAASFKRVVIVAAVGVFIGAATSTGMMDVVRHGIFRPENFSFFDLMCIFMAVMVTDIILLDIFNTLGLPTSTTVSMVFEILGAAFVVSLIKMAQGVDLGFNDLLNTEKAFTVILGIFLSVAIAFVFGTIVQFLSRTIFTFNYRSKLKWKIGIYGGLCSTAITYFLLINGAKDLTFMTPEVKAWISTHTLLIVSSCLVGFTLLMQLLHACKVNVLKVVVLLGTFALAMAFAGNDLVNFIGVSLSGLDSYRDYVANGGGDPTGHMMGVLNGPANTPFWIFLGAGAIMVVSLATSKKARHVTETEIGLGSQSGGDEMFGSSKIARHVVRWALSVITWMSTHTPTSVKRWFNRRFNTEESIIDQGAAFDLIRGSVNLVLSGILIAIGTSMKLPLSTTFVTFMVAMGTSLSDRAWSRESAVFRITGVVSVIGGWFLTAGVAFIGAGIIVLLMHFGGVWVMIALALITVYILYRSNRRFHKKMKEQQPNKDLFNAILHSTDKDETWKLLLNYIKQKQATFLTFAREAYNTTAEAFIKDNPGALGKMEKALTMQKSTLKNSRRKETICFSQLSPDTAMEKSAWFYLSNNCCMSILYNLRRINEICREHVDNNFHPLPKQYASDLASVQDDITTLLNDTLAMLEIGEISTALMIRSHCDKIKDRVSALYHSLQENLSNASPEAVTVTYVYLNTLQETQEMVSSLRKYVRAYAKLCDSSFSSRRARQADSSSPQSEQSHPTAEVAAAVAKN